MSHSDEVILIGALLEDQRRKIYVNEFISLREAFHRNKLVTLLEIGLKKINQN